ncbi:MAG: sialate O-acetylesterase [Treponema sp.]|jgi:sialate O-acetylesterase|nr:sialate O-acetylesterase [Treponema sp.]
MGWVTLSPVLSDSMVLQRDLPVPIWGETLPAAHITVSFLGKNYSAQAGQNGKWNVVLEPAAAGGPYELKITSKESTEIYYIKDIYIGDVWLCSGQSNMELPMQRLKDDFPEEWQNPVNPLIRQFKVPQEWDFSGPREELSGGQWTVAAAETLDEFSGTAWFFAKTIFEKYNVPIGLINTAWGGTPVEAWMSREALAPFPHKIAQGEQYADPALCRAITQKSEAAMQAWEDAALRSDAGLAQSWRNPETDVSQWGIINLPGAFCGEGLDKFCGSVWLRREFEVSAEFAAFPSKIWLGTIIDADTVFINGTEVGSTAYRYPPRKYCLPAGLLHEGTNTIVIRVVCCNGDGGVTKGKAFTVFSEKGGISLEGAWKYQIGMCSAPRPEMFFFQRVPMGLFNAMLSPVLKLPCKGMLWYQGESNDGNAGEYADLFAAMITGLRAKKRSLCAGTKELPFLFVQLPVFGEPMENNESSSWAIIREAQRSVLSLPETGMAAGLDLGEWNDLHPINKKDVGRRLALAADQVVFKNRNTAPGPLHRATERRQNRLFFTFDNCGKGLTAREKPYVSIISGSSLYRLPADISGPESLSVDISSINKPEKVLYAWANNPKDRQLFNEDGLPAIPFRVSIEELVG